MKKQLQLLLLFFLAITAKAQIFKNAEVQVPGTLNTILSKNEKSSITDLTITGNLDARDFRLMRDSMPNLSVLDIHSITIQAYSGSAGTYPQSASYPANEVPQFAFFNPVTGVFNKSLKDVSLPASITSFGTGAFALSTGLTSINISAKVDSIGENAFIGCSARIDVDPDNLKYAGTDGCLFNKSGNKLIHYPTSKAGSYEIPSTVDTISAYTFYNCTALTSITIPSKVVVIGSSAFNNCTGLSSVTINNRPEKISLDASVFYNVNTNSCVLNVPYGTKFLFQTASQWRSFTNITESTHGFTLNKSSLILLSNSSSAEIKISAIEAWSVSCDQPWLTLNTTSGIGTDTVILKMTANPTNDNRTATLTFSASGVESQTVTVTQSGLPKTVNISAGGLSSGLTANELKSQINLKIKGTIDARDFKTMRDYMPKLTFLDLSEATIVAYSGSDGTNSNSTSYPANTIPDYAFYNNSGIPNSTLTNITLPSSITATGTSAFYSCYALTEITIPALVTKLGSQSFAYCSNLNRLSIGNNVATISYGCFQACPQLSKAIIPNSVSVIESAAFNSCPALTEVSLGTSVNTIGSYAFSNCPALKSIYTLADNPINLNSSYSVFSGVNTSTCVLNVPFGMKNAYANAYQWKDFTNITENTQGFILDSNTAQVAAADGSTTTIKITSNNEWTVSSDQSWLKVNPVSGTGNNTITITADLNSLLVTRTATVTVSVPGVVPKTITVIQGASPKIVNITAGGLTSALTATELNTISSLTVTGTIDARDFKTMRDNIPQLAYVDLSGANILAYTGSGGTIGYYNVYAANQVPQNAFATSYSGKASLRSVILPSTSTSVGSCSFQYCSGLTSVRIPETVTSIGYYAFASCSSLKDITLPHSLNKIESYTFSKCSKLNKIEIPGSVTSISFNAFEYCSGLTDITIPGSVTFIDSYAFQYCSGLTDVTIPNSVTSMGSSVFMSCTGLKSFVFPETMSLIPSGTFAGCSKLSIANIPNAVETIDYNAFNACSGLTTINWGSKIKTLGNGAFESCTSLSQTVLPNTVTSINDNVFRFCSVLTSISIPESVTSIGSEAFNGCTSLKEITIPNSVTKLSSQIFNNCTGLTSVKFGNSISSIEYGAFANCKSLNHVAIPNSVKSIGNSAFSSCSGLSDISLSDSLTSIGSSAFYNCTSLNKAKLSGTLKSIGSSAFTYTGLTDIIIPDSVTEIGDEAFRSCPALTSFVNSNSVKRIGSMTFSDCNKLANVSLGKSVTYIAYLAFNNCASLSGLILPENLKTIGNNAFRSCTSLTSITIPNSVTSIEPYAFQSCSGLTGLTLSSSLSTIESSVFSGCSGLTDVVIPGSVKAINSYAFSACSNLNTLFIPGSVTSIGSSAFESCTGLKSIYANARIPVDITNNPYVFSNVDKINCTLHVPFHTKALYAVADQWKDFNNIVENPYGLVVDTDSITLSVKAGSTAKLNITSNTGWSAVTDQAWLSVTPSSATGNNTINLTAEANPLYHPRTAIIIINAANIEPQLVYVTQEAATKTVNISAGGLATSLTHDEHISMTNLCIKGTLDARDFKFMRDTIPNLTNLNISETSVNAYTGTLGTEGSYLCAYPANTIPQYAFYNTSSSNHTIALKSILLPASITSIGSGAFEYCNQIDSINIPNSVTSINNYAFESCKGLKNVTLSNSMTSIGRVFCYCQSLTSIVIPNSVTAISYDAFASCTALNKVTFGNSVASIGSNAFYNCYRLQEITIPNSVKTIGYQAFYCCTGLTKVTFGNSLSVIDFNAFANCSALTGVVLPNSLTTLGSSAFQSCNSMTSVTIPASITSVGSNAFSCNGLKSVFAQASTPINFSSSYVFYGVDKNNCTLYVPRGTKSLYQAASQWKDFSNIDDSKGLELSTDTVIITSGGSRTIKIKTTNSWTITSDQNWVKVDSISGTGDAVITLTGDTNPSYSLRTASLTVNSFGPSQNITVIQSGIPKTVDITSGGLSSALTSDELKTVSNLVIRGTLDARDFRVMRDDMPQLSYVDLSNVSITAYNGSEGTNTSIYNYPANELPAYAFYKSLSAVGKKALSSVILPSNITSIGIGALAYSKSLSGIVIPDQVKSIGHHAFNCCTRMENVTIGKSVTSIESGTFYMCMGIQKLVIPESVVTIGESAFQVCTGLTEVIIPNSVVTISAYAFEECSSLTEVVIPNSVKSIGYEAFIFCSGLKKVTLPNSLTTLEGSVFSYCYSLTDINIPNTITEIKESTFMRCYSLKEITIPNSVQTIGYRAFSDCTGFSSFSIPASVTKISHFAFENCTGLTSLYAYPLIPVVFAANTNIFANLNKSKCVLYVPAGSKALYQAADQWKDFAHIIEITTGISSEWTNKINIYPNPARDQIRITGLDNKAGILIYDASGKLLISKQVNNNETIPVDQLSYGVYLTRIVTSDGIVERRLLKE